MLKSALYNCLQLSTESSPDRGWTNKRVFPLPQGSGIWGTGRRCSMSLLCWFFPQPGLSPNLGRLWVILAQLHICRLMKLSTRAMLWADDPMSKGTTVETAFRASSRASKANCPKPEESSHFGVLSGGSKPCRFQLSCLSTHTHTSGAVLCLSRAESRGKRSKSIPTIPVCKDQLVTIQCTVQSPCSQMSHHQNLACHNPGGEPKGRFLPSALICANPPASKRSLAGATLLQSS